MLTFKKHVWFTSLLLGMVAAVIVTTPAEARKSKTAIRIDMQAKASLNKLLKSIKDARNLKKNAKAILVFPTILKGELYTIIRNTAKNNLTLLPFRV